MPVTSCGIANAEKWWGALTEGKNLTHVMFTLCLLFTAEALKFNLLQLLIQKHDLVKCAHLCHLQPKKKEHEENWDGWEQKSERILQSGSFYHAILYYK